MVTEVTEDPVESGGVQLGIIDEKKNEEARESFMIEQLSSAELDVVCRS